MVALGGGAVSDESDPSVGVSLSRNENEFLAKTVASQLDYASDDRDVCSYFGGQ